MTFKTITTSLLASFCTVFSFYADAQCLQLSSSQLSFGVVTETQAQTLNLTVSNTCSSPIDITSIKFYSVVQSMPFSVSNTSYTIPAGGSVVIPVTFLPIHNILHNTEMVLTNNSNRGVLSIDLVGQGRYSNTYYGTTENLFAEDLKNALTARLALGYNQLGYNAARDAMFMTIDNRRTNGQLATINTLECIYTGRLITGYTSRTVAQNAPNNFNTEHTWPQSLFGSSDPMVSDLNHLFPTDANANNVRGNDPFGMVATPTWTEGGSKSNGTVFETRNQQKGQTARAMLYFGVRYKNASITLGFLTGQEAILRQWSKQYPPTAIDKRRNNDVQAVQGNRNPFIDYPQLLDRISNLTSVASVASVLSINLPDTLINFGAISPTFGNVNDIYSYVMVNNGNQPIQVDNFAISNNGFRFVGNTNTPTVINAGEKYTLKLEYNPMTLLPFPLAANLTFSTNIATRPNIVVPIVLNNISTGIDLNAKKYGKTLTIYPNPASVWIRLAGDNQNTNLGVRTIEVSDIWGQLVLKNLTDTGQIDISTLQRGIYFLKVSGENHEIRFGKFVKQ